MSSNLTYKGDPIINEIRDILGSEDFRNKIVKTYLYTLSNKERGNPDIMVQLMSHYFLEISNVTRDIMVNYINKEVKEIEKVYNDNKVDACLDVILLLKKLQDHQL